MLIELQKVPSQELKRDYYSPIGMNRTKNYGYGSLTLFVHQI